MNFDGSFQPFVVWFTGLPGSGKTTLARGVAAALRARGVKVRCVDGDALRRRFPRTGFSRRDRDRHVRRAGRLARELQERGYSVVAALVSPYAQSRRFVRRLCRHFLEVHVSTPLRVCERRDPKGLYARARRGELRGMTGIDDPYEPPGRGGLRIDTSRVSKSRGTRRVLRELERRMRGGGP